jgi:hypothetical protein
MDLTKRQAFLCLAAIAAPAIIRTPGLLMPVRYRQPLVSAALIARRRADKRLGKVSHLVLTPESRAVIARASALGFYRLPPLQLVVRREAFRTALGNRKP